MFLNWIICFWDSSAQNHAEPSWNYLKKSVLDPKRAKLNQNSDFAHVRTYSRLHTLRNTQGKIYGTYLGNIYGIYEGIIRNNKFVNKNWKGVKSEKIKVFPLVCSKYLSSWTGPDMTEVRVLVQFWTFRVQRWSFDEIYRWFCIIFAGEAQKSRYFDQKP